MKKGKKRSTVKAVRNLLASAALATALISWIATAEGMNTYVFEHYWQAAIFSAAIQGTLFAFSVQAIPLMKKLKAMGRVAMIILWIALLCSSSIFSYVYMSQSVYSDKLLEDDANRILSTTCLEKYMVLGDILDIQKDAQETDLGKYITLLASREETIVLSEESLSIIDGLINDINSEVISDIITSKDLIIPILNNMKAGKYSSSDIASLKEYINEEILTIKAEIDACKSNISSYDTKITEWNGRLLTFNDVSSIAYSSLLEQILDAEQDRKNADERRKNLEKYVGRLETSKTSIDYIENSLEKELYDKTLELRKYMNEEDLDVDKIQQCAEEIYEVLLDNNVSASDERLVEYREFRNNVNEYKVMMTSKTAIELAIKYLYDYSTMSREINENWHDKIIQIQDITKDIPQIYFDTYGQVTKTEIVEEMSALDRLYLSDLNKFELMWTLLFNSVHTYKTLLLFSVVMAFGLDLFSFGVGMLLYYVKDNKREETEKSN